MSELRFNLITWEWVIIASDRAKRPKDFKKAKGGEPPPKWVKECPFCPGNEEDSVKETFRLGDASAWRVRSIYNKYPALSPDQEPARSKFGVYNFIKGFGAHEVMIENPRHDLTIATMEDREVEDIMRAYKERYVSIQKMKGIEAITIFKNQGPAAGASLLHPHSQLVATPIVPPQTRSRIENAVMYFDITGKCLFCATMEQELNEAKRIVFASRDFVSIVPYAAYSPFAIWIFPRRHMSSFAAVSDDELKDLAKHLKTVLGKLYRGLDNPDFNYTIRSIPVRESGTEYFHWYISVIPRISNPAGFELGSGIFINASLPEECAEFLRQTP